MPKKNLHYYLLKAARLSAWLLLLLMILYISTGFVLCGEFGMSRWMDLQTALHIHQIFEWPLVAFFLIHASITVYFSFRRWGWIKSKNKKCD
jgi:cytochrome b subunit of formate dehydrogenase